MFSEENYAGVWCVGIRIPYIKGGGVGRVSVLLMTDRQTDSSFLLNQMLFFYNFPVRHPRCVV